MSSLLCSVLRGAVLFACVTAVTVGAQAQTEPVSDWEKSVRRIVDRWIEATGMNEPLGQRCIKVLATASDPKGTLIKVHGHWKSASDYTVKQVRNGATMVDAGRFAGRVFRFHPGLGDYEVLEPEEKSPVMTLLAALSNRSLYTMVQDAARITVGSVAEIAGAECDRLAVNDTAGFDFDLFVSKQTGRPSALDFTIQGKSMRILYSDWESQKAGEQSFSKMKLVQGPREMEFSVRKLELVDAQPTVPGVVQAEID